MRAIITALFLILFSQSAGAEKSGYLISAYSCGTYLSYCETETGCMVGTNWINGFLSAASLYGKPIRPVDGESVQKTRLRIFMMRLNIFMNNFRNKSLFPRLIYSKLVYFKEIKKTE